MKLCKPPQIYFDSGMNKYIIGNVPPIVMLNATVEEEISVAGFEGGKWMRD